MINMRSFFLVFLFTFTTILVETPHCRADGDFYEQLRKKKHPSASEVDAIRKRTSDEKRRSSVNQIAAEGKADADEVKKLPDVIPGEPTTQNDIPESEEDKEPTSPQAPVKSAPQAGKSRPSAPVTHDSSPGVKVNPGDVDELSFPGEAKPKATPKKKK
jgi:hypothetical protein